ncbi:hypothetical protein L218DRAFT_238512 [Marasmius fiardii PR-910]|nr:hypothetical protein L218DRAFT_238512 [Marasmius fiardii PR-910]
MVYSVCYPDEFFSLLVFDASMSLVSAAFAAFVRVCRSAYTVAACVRTVCQNYLAINRQMDSLSMPPLFPRLRISSPSFA